MIQRQERLWKRYESRKKKKMNECRRERKERQKKNYVEEKKAKLEDVKNWNK